jgi:hypothetical protein
MPFGLVLLRSLFNSETHTYPAMRFALAKNGAHV